MNESATIQFVNKWLICLTAMFLLSACFSFDDAGEDSTDEDGDVSGANLAVRVYDVDHNATVVVVELVWAEQGVVGELVLEKRVAITPETAGQGVTVSFTGLGAGIGHPRAGAFVGSIVWQEMVDSANIQLSGEGQAESTISLGTPVGDPDLSFDWDPFGPDGDPEMEKDSEVIEDGDELIEDGDIKVDGDADSEEVSVVSINVPFTFDDPVIDGQIENSEWSNAQTIEIVAIADDNTLVRLMHNSLFLFVSVYMPNMSSDNEQSDQVRLAFDPDIGVDQDEFIYTVNRISDRTVCDVANPGGSVMTCTDLINGTPVNSSVKREFSDGWMVEYTVTFSSLNLSAGQSKKLRFGVRVVDNNESFSWPLMVNFQQQSTWGVLKSKSSWDAPSIDGDADVELSPEEDIEDDPIVDGDPDDITTDGDDAEESDEPVADGDPDTVQEQDSDSSEIEEGEPGFCTPMHWSCFDIEGIYRARKCNDEGTGFEVLEVCTDSKDCTDDGCQEGAIGCTFTPNYLLCNDDNYCTEFDQCNTQGECVGEWMSCNDDNPCTEDLFNTALPECCYHQDDNEGESCTDGIECTPESYCYHGECTGSLTPGCCEGYDDMVFVELQGGYCIDKYEAVIGNLEFVDDNDCATGGGGTRYGETNDDFPAGFPDNVTEEIQTTELYACNVAGLIPTRFLTLNQAKVACQNMGKHICTQAEFMSACGGPSSDTYPYGSTYSGSTCNGADYDIDTPALENTGTLFAIHFTSLFVSSLPADTKSNNPTPIFPAFEQACGGSYIGSEGDITCQSCVSRTWNTSTAIRGFRCCATPNALP